LLEKIDTTDTNAMVEALADSLPKTTSVKA
jgi:hypothetical protein